MLSFSSLQVILLYEYCEPSDFFMKMYVIYDESILVHISIHIVQAFVLYILDILISLLK